MVLALLLLRSVLTLVYSSVTAVAPPKMARGPHNGNRVADARRNLYVLGLPFDLSKYVLHCSGRYIH